MTGQGYDVYIVPSSDSHNSEYVPEAWQRRAWLSGFTGSVGTLVVSQQKAWLLTDSRYWLQAEAELDQPGQPIALIKEAPTPAALAACIGKIDKVKTVAYDHKLMTISDARALQGLLAKAADSANFKAQNDEANLIDQMRQQAGLAFKPEREMIEAQPLSYAGKSAESKLSELRDTLRNHKADHIVLTALDDIAWLLNIRGSDVDFNPLVISYFVASVSGDHIWFVDQSKLPESLSDALRECKVQTKPYDSFNAYLESLANKQVWLDTKSCNRDILDRLESISARILQKTSPIVLAKACKNSVEITGTKQAHLRDAAAVVQFLHWLEHAVDHDLDEWKAAEKLSSFRSTKMHFKGLSFPVISGFGPNGAVVHYSVKKDTARKIDRTSLYLVDSGGQYLDGTTDITRTVHLGEPTAEQKSFFTAVLRGHLALANARFPQGTAGIQLDVLARQFLWAQGVNFGHGTGHGVGSYLCVHEGPQAISSATKGSALTPLQAGMIVSNEPGFYKEGAYGIRIENLVLVTESKNDDSTSNDEQSDQGFLCFDDLTLVPYQKSLIDVQQLTTQERELIDAYHQRVWKEVSPMLSGSAEAACLDWLKNATSPLI